MSYNNCEGNNCEGNNCRGNNCERKNYEGNSRIRSIVEVAMPHWLSAGYSG